MQILFRQRHVKTEEFPLRLGVVLPAGTSTKVSGTLSSTGPHTTAGKIAFYRKSPELIRHRVKKGNSDSEEVSRTYGAPTQG